MAAQLPKYHDHDRHPGTDMSGLKTGAIIAGGLGTRVRSVLAETPKCLAPINGEPFIFIPLRQMILAGVSRLVLCTGYGSDQVEQCIGSQFSGVPVLYSREREPLGTGGAIKLAFDRYGQEDSWLVMNGDSYLELDLVHFHTQVHLTSSIAGIAAVRVDDARRFGGMNCSADWRIVGFQEKSGNMGPKWINGGVYVLTSRLLLGMPEQTPLSLERDTFPACVEHGLLAFPCTGGFIDIGTPESFAEAQRFFRNS